MTRCKDPAFPTGWAGLGQPVSDRCGSAGSECGTTDRDVLATLAHVLGMTTPRRRQCITAMLWGTGATSTPTERALAHRARAQALKVGVWLPPWWRLRLAVRRAHRHGAPLPKGFEAPRQQPRITV